MLKTPLFEAITAVIGNFPDAYRELLSGISTVKVFAKDEAILEQGRFCKHLWFLNKGAVKAYETVDGVDRLTYFFTDNTFFTNYYCWVTGNPSDITFRAVEPSEITLIDYPKLEELCQKHHIFDTIGRKMAERIFVTEYMNRKLFCNVLLPKGMSTSKTSAPKYFNGLY